MVDHALHAIRTWTELQVLGLGEHTSQHVTLELDGRDFVSFAFESVRARVGPRAADSVF